MKTKLATALSLVGVLGAGSAAALVNTQILDGGGQAADASAVLTPGTITASTAATSTSSTTPTTTVDPTTTAAAPTTAAVTTPTIATPAMAPTGFLTSYNVGAAGVVTVDVADGRAVLVSATPGDGWSLVDTDDGADDVVEVKFANATTLVEFKVAFVNGQLVPTVESTSIGGGSGPSSPATPPANTTATTVTRNTVDDDDHDDDDHDDDRDDDDHGDDDHGGDDDDHDDD